LLSIDEFEEKLLLPSVRSMRAEPMSYHKSFAAIWTLDAYASHLAHVFFDRGDLIVENERIIESFFKDSLCESEVYKSWHFQLLRDISNSGKHAKLSKSKLREKLVMSSGEVMISDYRGTWVWMQRPEHWGEMLTVELDLMLEIGTNKWRDRSGKIYDNQIFRSVAITQVVTTSLCVLNSARPSNALKMLIDEV
jgi:hypothetical protein